jgi:hypothetical protein
MRSTVRRGDESADLMKAQFHRKKEGLPGSMTARFTGSPS